MPYLIEGNAREIFTDFGHQMLLQSNGTPKVMLQDLERTQLFGRPEDNLQHRAIWQDFAQSPPAYYSQGNMTAVNVSLIFGNPPTALMNENEDLEYFQQQVQRQVRIPYVGQAQQNARALFLFYRKDDPTKWIIVSAKNLNKLPEESEIKILTSFDPREFLQPEATCGITLVKAQENALFTNLDSPPLKTYLRTTLNERGQFNPGAANIEAYLQSVAPEQDYLDNNELLDSFEANVAAILASKHLRLLVNNGIRLEQRQVQDCLHPASEIYQALSAIEHQKSKAQLKILVFLDKHGLNARRDVILNQTQLRFADGVADFRAKLSFLIELHDQHKLIPYLTDDNKLASLLFIMHSENDHLNEFFGRLANATEAASIENKLSNLSQQEWNFPTDSFRHAVICQMAIAHPEISIDTLISVADALQRMPSLQRVFSPRELADFLVKDTAENLVSKLQAIEDYFTSILEQLEQIAVWSQESISAEFLQLLGVKYIADPLPSEFLRSLSVFCTKQSQIEACYVLKSLGIETEKMTALILNNAIVFTINTLHQNKLDDLINPVITASGNSAALNAIYKLPAQSRAAALILFAQDQLDPHEFETLGQAFRQHEQLDEVILKVHGRGFTPEQVKALAFDPKLHRAAKVLEDYAVDYHFSDLTPFTCQLIHFLVELMKKSERQNEAFTTYLQAVLPSLIRYFRSEIEHAELLSQINGQLSAFQYLVDRNLIALSRELAGFINNQALVFKRVRPLVKNYLIAGELGQAIAMIEGLGKTEDEKRTFCAAVAQGFSSLEESVSPSTTTYAVNALVICHSLAGAPDCVELLRNETLAHAICCLHAQKMDVAPLLAVPAPLRQEVADSLIKLSKIEPINRDAVQLALQIDDDGKGKDFRRLLSRGLFTRNCSLWALWIEGIETRKQTTSPNAINKLVSETRQDIRKKAYHLDETMVLINRLRAIDASEEIVDFMAKESTSRYFCKAILKIENECQKIRKRLEQDAPQKYAKLVVSEKLYRRELYQTIYEAFNSKPSDGEDLVDLRTKISQAESHIRDVLEEDRSPWLRRAMLVIANTVTLTCTLGIANAVHKNKTGDFLFWYRPESSEAIKRLQREVEDMVTQAKAGA